MLSTYFEADKSAAIVNDRMSKNADPRLRQIMEIVVRNLHEAVREAAITPEEWMKAIQFLTETGQMCSDWRQEFILLSDVLGVSMLVESINHDRPSEATENTVLGPFHVQDAPRRLNGANICLDGKGEPMLVHGRVTDVQGEPVAGALLDVWQANEDGYYDVQQKNVQPAYNLRGIFETDLDGKFWFRTAKPRWYPIPNDGPVGHLLDSLGRQPNRPAHLHFIVTAPHFQTVTTHIFAPDCPYIEDDAVFGVKRSLIAQFNKIDDPVRSEELGFSEPFWEVEWNFKLVSTDA